MRHWLLKSEPETYSWADLCRLKQDHWDGVRNYQARNHIREMGVKDQAFFYHSGKEKAIVGIVEVVSAPYPDPTLAMPHPWVVVDVRPWRPLKRPLPLKELKKLPEIANMTLFHNSRLSVQSVSSEDFNYICDYAQSFES